MLVNEKKVFRIGGRSRKEITIRGSPGNMLRPNAKPIPANKNIKPNNQEKNDLTNPIVPPSALHIM
ncbi:hypothetical protein HN388_08150 [bacterium]|jgi:hypothetical protein|nr:hypothetical protein [bacterium]